MSDTTSLSFRVPRAKAEQLERLAGAMDRPRSWLLQRALDAYLDIQSWHIAHIEEGWRELREGKGIPHEEVIRSADRWAGGNEDEISAPE